MVCPIKDQINRKNLDTATEYPYESLYRPWSWVLSSFSNLFLFAFVFIIAYILYRKRKRSGDKATVSYRRVVVREGEEGKVNVLVTGAGGCMGTHLVDCLLKDGGYNVHCLDLHIPLEHERNGEVCSYTQTDICSYDDLQISVRGMQAVFHTADISPQDGFVKKKDFHYFNVTGTENIIKACKECNVKRLIYTSTATVVVGQNWKSENVDESTPYPERPLNVYLHTKAISERLVLEAGAKDGLLSCAMRPAAVLFSVHNRYMQDLLTQTMFVVKGLNYGMSYVSAASAAQAHVLAEKNLRDGPTSTAAGKAYNIGSKERVQCHDLYGELASDEESIWGQPPPHEIPMWALTLIAYINHFSYKLTGATLVYKCLSPLFLDDFAVEQSFSSARAHQELGWEEPRGWKEIIQELVKEHRAEKEGKKEQ